MCLTLAGALAAVLLQGGSLDPGHTPSESVAPTAATAIARPTDQQPASPNGFTPMTTADRVDWIVGGTIGLQSLGIGVMAAALQTGFDSPREWRRSWEGFGRRYAAREADVAISNSIEAGLGAIWGEQASYVRSRVRGIRPRLRHALQTVFLAERRDGHLAPAWGRYAGNVFNNLIENEWLPPSLTTWQATTLRSLSGFGSRAIGNVWEEFGPDVMRLVLRRPRQTPRCCFPMARRSSRPRRQSR